MNLRAVCLGLLLTAWGEPAAAQGNPYAVVTINNDTGTVTLNFQYRWGDGPWQESKDFNPGRARWFAVPLDANGKAPTFQIRLNQAIGAAAADMKVYNLRCKAAPARDAKFGRQYQIVRDKARPTYVIVLDQQR